MEREADLVVVFNMQSVGGFPKPWCLVEVPQVAPKVLVVHDALLVALYMGLWLPIDTETQDIGSPFHWVLFVDPSTFSA